MTESEVWAASTSLRVQSVAQTLVTATELMARLGITDLSDVTADDQLGVPVWFCARREALTTNIHCGKGLESAEARVGALMEGIEHAAAERAALRGGGKPLRLDALLSQFEPPLTNFDLSPRLGAPWSPEREVLSDECTDVVTGARYFMPAELLHLPAPDGGIPGGLFGGWSSNGLASGNSLDEATLHALLEVIERDTAALDLARPWRRPVRPASLPPPFADWTERWAAMGIELKVACLSNEFDVPCIEAEITQPGSLPPRRSLGFGVHPRKSIALARAVTEAAQSRLYALRFGADRGPVSALPTPRSRPTVATAVVDFDSLPELAFQNVPDTLASVIARLQARGLRWVLRRSLNLLPDASDLAGLHVVRVVVPGCETALGVHPRLGRRLAERLLQRA